MRDNRSLFAAALLAAGIASVACGGQTSSSSSGSSPANSPVASAAASGDSTTIHLVINGGSGAGTYDLKSADSCTFLKTNHLWNAGFGDASSTTVTSVTIAADTTNSPTTVTFDVQTGGTSGPIYDISTIVPGHGSATVDIQDSGLTAKISVTGMTKEGYQMTANVQCNKIDRPQG